MISCLKTDDGWTYLKKQNQLESNSEATPAQEKM